MDILQATLAAGIRVSKYVPSYGDQPNDVQHVVKCGSFVLILSLGVLTSLSSQTSEISSGDIMYALNICMVVRYYVRC